VLKQSRLAKLLEEKQPSIGGWITLCEPSVGIIFSHAGFDWVVIDTEHNPFTEAQVQGLIHAMRDSDMTPIVRVRSNDPAHFKWVLDCGAGGLLVPFITDAADVKRAVEAAKYWPLGVRGYGPTRAVDFGAHRKEYLDKANTDILLIIQIERQSALDDIEEIAQIEGLDGIWVGPNDLAQGLGHFGDIGHPEVQEAIGKIIATANKYGKPWGFPVACVEDYIKYAKQGAKLMTVGTDANLLVNAANKLVSDSFAALEKAGLRKG